VCLGLCVSAQHSIAARWEVPHPGVHAGSVQARFGGKKEVARNP
jgi:hypothetical protein